MSDERVEKVRRTLHQLDGDFTTEAEAALDSLEAELTELRGFVKVAEAAAGDNYELLLEARAELETERQAALKKIAELEAELTRLRQVAEAAKAFMVVPKSSTKGNQKEFTDAYRALRSALEGGGG